MDNLQATIVTQAAIDPTQGVQKIAVFDASGAPATVVVTAASVGAALKVKPAIAALTSGSTAAQIVAALQA